MRKDAHNVRRKKRHVIAWIVFGLVLALFACGAGFVLQAVLSAPKLDTLDVRPKGYRSTVYDDAGDPILTLFDVGSNRVYVTIAEMPKDLQHAFVAIEDERFYEHKGVDFRGIARAVFRAVKNGGLKEGASTITQQLIKNNVFTDWTGEKSLREKVTRKIQEQYLALQLERSVPKEWILENYLNTINLGGGTFGVETASRYYFDKDVSDLTLSECAVLAGITKNPSKYNPRNDAAANASRRETILKKMQEQGYITEEAYQEALSDEVYARIEEVQASRDASEVMSYYEDELLRTLICDLTESYELTEEEAWDLIYTGGLSIDACVDSDLQSEIEEAASSDEYYGADVQTSIVLIDNESGAVKAMVGGRGAKDASLTLNRATSAEVQPGSTLKVIGEYAAGLEQGLFTLGTAIADAPYSYSDGTSISNANGAYGGMTTVRRAISSSNNIVALKCLQEAGIGPVMDQLAAFGISTLNEDDRVESLALGGTCNGVTNLEMTAAYSAIARGGEYRTPIYYTEVRDRYGEVILTADQEVRRAVSTETAALLTSAMEDVIGEGTGRTAGIDGVALAGKSGTTSGVRDAWFIGYSPAYSCGVWGGYDNHSEQESSAYVQEVWRQVMLDVSAEDAGAFTGTESLVACEICTKCGKLAVPDLCDHTEQGDMTAVEYFVPGTEPTADCDCHIELTLCKSSGKVANRYCTNTETKVYLKKATPGTDDENYVLPAGLDDTKCSVHKHNWFNWFGGGGSEEDDDSSYEPQPTPTPTPTPEAEPEEKRHWWDWFF